jgi:hypothetical protein
MLPTVILNRRSLRYAAYKNHMFEACAKVRAWSPLSWLLLEELRDSPIVGPQPSKGIRSMNSLVHGGLE